MKIKAFILSLIIAFSFVGCEKDDSTADISTIGIPATITILGDNPYFMGVGGEYIDAGVTVEGGTLVKTIENISPTVPGTYFVEYHAKNNDGLISYARRSVNALAPQTPLSFTFQSGQYDCTLAYLREGAEVTIKEVAPGIIYCSDAFLGYYEQYRGYGSAYAAPVILNHKGGGVWEPQEKPNVAAWGTLTMGDITITENSTSWTLTFDEDGYNYGLTPFIGNLITK